MDINITPALNIEERKNLSYDEFQNQLCSWLESKGLLSELRAYFRCNMIEVLKNTALGSSLTCKSKQPTTPKMQAMNLLISEYFIYSQYHFSLCVFCTEVSLNNMLPEGTNTGTLVSKRPVNFKFTEKQVYDILESTGLIRHNKQAQKIYTAYCELDEPLISYFLPSSSLTSLTLDEKMEYFPEDADLDYKVVSENINTLIMNSNLNSGEILQLQQYIKWICDKFHEREVTLAANMKEEFRGQLKKYKSKLCDIQRSFESDRNKFERDITRMKQAINSLSSKNKSIKKQKIPASTMITTLNEQLLQTEIMTDHKSTDAVVKVQDEVTQHVEEKQTPIVKVDKESQTLTNVPLESAVLKHVVQQLEKENNILKSENFNYCEQIDELANRAAILMNELNVSQQNIVRLNNLLQNTTNVFVPMNISGKQNTLLYTGAGEECVGAFKHKPLPNFRNLSKSRKVPTKKTTPNSESSSGSVTSPTDELLKQAKRRLKDLEIESEHIDQKILNFTEAQKLISSTAKNQMTGQKRYHFNARECANVFKFGASTEKNESETGSSNVSLTPCFSASGSFCDLRNTESNEDIPSLGNRHQET